MKKRILSMFLAVITIITSVVLTSFTVSAAESGSCGENVTWSLDTDTGVLTISGEGAMVNQTASNGSPWYKIRDSIKALVIEDGVTTIGTFAFCNCSNMESVTLGADIISIRSGAFSYCTSLNAVYITDFNSWLNIDFETSPLSHAHNLYLTSGEQITEIVLPDGMTAIKDGVFWGGSSFTSITIPDSVTSIGNSAFRECSALVEIIIPENVTSIGSLAFSGCIGLTSIIIPEKVAELGVAAFEDCTALQKINIPSGIKVIESGTFSGCDSLKNISIPEGVTTIDSSAFSHSISLESVYIANGVTSIGRYAFRGCVSLEEIVLPDSVVSIEPSAFLETAYYDNKDNWVDNVLYISNQLIKADPAISGDYIIRDETVTIASNAFYNCSSLESITVPEGVKAIGGGAFGSCNSLRNISLPDSLRSIGSVSFNNTAYFNNAENWEDNALYISNHLIEVSGDIKVDCIIREGTICIADDALSRLSVPIVGSDEIDFDYIDVVIPDSVKVLGKYSFSNNRVCHIFMGSGVERIEDHAFWKTCANCIYYSGTEEQWNNIYVDDPDFGNMYLYTAKFYFLGDSECPVTSLSELSERSEKAFDKNGRITISLECDEVKESVFSFTAWDDGDYYIYTDVSSIYRFGKNHESSVEKLWIFDGDGNEIEEAYVDGTTKKAVTLECIAGKTYYVAVKSFNITTGTYGLYGEDCTTDVIINYNSGVLGDASGDGKLNGKDALLIKKYLVSAIDQDALSIISADCSGDGKISSRDLFIIKKLMVG